MFAIFTLRILQPNWDKIKRNIIYQIRDRLKPYYRKRNKNLV